MQLLFESLKIRRRLEEKNSFSLFQIAAIVCMKNKKHVIDQNIRFLIKSDTFLASYETSGFETLITF